MVAIALGIVWWLRVSGLLGWNQGVTFDTFDAALVPALPPHKAQMTGQQDLPSALFR